MVKYKNDDARLLASLIHRLDDLVFSRENFPITTIDTDGYYLDERKKKYKCFLASYTPPPTETYRVYRSAVNKRNHFIESLVGLAAHEVRHRMQKLRKDEISFTLQEKMKKLKPGFFVYARYVLCVLNNWLNVLWSYKWNERFSEMDTFFIQYLAERDYKKHHNLRRIAKIVQL
ncbi:MAG: hypothetical protein ABH822_00960 [Patescibacteria group bacterium]